MTNFYSHYSISCSSPVVNGTMIQYSHVSCLWFSPLMRNHKLPTYKETLEIYSRLCADLDLDHTPRLCAGPEMTTRLRFGPETETETEITARLRADPETEITARLRAEPETEITARLRAEPETETTARLRADQETDITAILCDDSSDDSSYDDAIDPEIKGDGIIQAKNVKHALLHSIDRKLIKEVISLISKKTLFKELQKDCYMFNIYAGFLKKEKGI